MQIIKGKKRYHENWHSLTMTIRKHLPGKSGQIMWTSGQPLITQRIVSSIQSKSVHKARFSELRTRAWTAVVDSLLAGLEKCS